MRSLSRFMTNNPIQTPRQLFHYCTACFGDVQGKQCLLPLSGIIDIGILKGPSPFPVPGLLSGSGNGYVRPTTEGNEFNHGDCPYSLR